MYKIVKRTSDSLKMPCDYLFYKFEKFYTVAKLLAIPLFGVYTINIVSDDIEEIQRFIKNEDSYAHLAIVIISDINVINYMSERDQSLRCETNVSQWDEFSKLVLERGVNFAKGVMSLTYASIEHDLVTMMDTLDMINDKFPNGKLVTKVELAQYILYKEIVYPKQVLDKFISMDRYRWSSLQKCERSIPKEIITRSIAKRLKKYLEAKGNYLSTGIADDKVININTGNLILAYRTFVLEKGGLLDPAVLFSLYEKGISLGG